MKWIFYFFSVRCTFVYGRCEWQRLSNFIYSKCVPRMICAISHGCVCIWHYKHTSYFFAYTRLHYCFYRKHNVSINKHGIRCLLSSPRVCVSVCVYQCIMYIKSSTHTRCNVSTINLNNNSPKTHNHPTTCFVSAHIHCNEKGTTPCVITQCYRIGLHFIDKNKRNEQMNSRSKCIARAVQWKSWKKYKY